MSWRSGRSRAGSAETSPPLTRTVLRPQPGPSAHGRSLLFHHIRRRHRLGAAVRRRIPARTTAPRPARGSVAELRVTAGRSRAGRPSERVGRPRGPARPWTGVSPAALLRPPPAAAIGQVLRDDTVLTSRPPCRPPRGLVRLAPVQFGQNPIEGLFSSMYAMNTTPLLLRLRALPGFVCRTAPIAGVGGRIASSDAISRRRAP